MNRLQEHLEQMALEAQNGGAFIGIAWRAPFEILYVRAFGERADWIRDFEELAERKIKLANRTGTSTRDALLQLRERLEPEYRDLHPGALLFNDRRLIVASSGFCSKNEESSTLVGEPLDDFDFCSEPLRLVATG
ncbi:MAG TPA: hypothetical protein VGE23_01865 [Candidatus Paceibacterota bacterium]